MLGDCKSGGYLRDGPLVYLPLGVADLVEGKPSHQTRDHGEDHGCADAHVQMKGDAVTSCEQAFQEGDHGFVAPFKERMGRYWPSLSSTVRKDRVRALIIAISVAELESL